MDECYWMAEAGTFEGKRVELLEGEVHVVTPQGVWHIRVIDRLNRLLINATKGDDLTVRVQCPLTLTNESEPEPDFSMFRPEAAEASDKYHPSSALLAIEVAQTTLAKDRGIKARLYARARVSEYWIVNLAQQTAEVYTEPDPEAGRYAQARTFERGHVLQGTSLPQIRVEVEALFK